MIATINITEDRNRKHQLFENSTDPLNNRRVIFSAFVFYRKVPKDGVERMKLSTDYQHNYHYYKLYRDLLSVGLLDRYREVRELID